MLANSPAGSCHFLDFDGLRAGGVTFWSIHKEGVLAGCGALKMLDGTHGEIKSMRTADAFPRWRSIGATVSRIVSPSPIIGRTLSAAS